MKPLWIDLMGSGVANRYEFEDHELIEVNWRLTNYPNLYAQVMKHELEHDDGKYSAKDFIHDMKSRTPGLFKFMINNPSSWNQILPFYWSFKRKQLIYDWSGIFSWTLMIGISTAIFFFLRWLL